ncbi:hypothetical protein NECID01_1099 [Nematocida sp. AWRm77]|nr:hypothetical protein NECID01_1099 [Nematocida sp. AWRm77]
MNIPEEEKHHERVETGRGNQSEAKKDMLSLKERVDVLEEQIRKTAEEYEKIQETVEKLKIVNSLLYKEVCKKYSTLTPSIEDEH